MIDKIYKRKVFNRAANSYEKFSGIQDQISQIDLLKIDVQGYEIVVLKGANNAITNGKVKILLAVCDFDSKDRLHTTFTDLWNHLKDNKISSFGLYYVIHYGKFQGINYCNKF